jgi:hypothetical protein
VEALTYRMLPFPEGFDETLGHIIRVHVVQRLPADIRKRDRSPFGKVTKSLRIEVCGRIQREPFLAHQMVLLQTLLASAMMGRCQGSNL